MTIREKLITAGINHLIESGHPYSNKDNILTDPTYKTSFIPMLKNCKGHSKVVNAEIDKLISECQLASSHKAKRYRTTFPNNVNFSGWWLLSRKGCVAQLIKNGRNLHEDILYVLRFKNGQIGMGKFTTSNLMETGAEYICPERADLPINDETKIH